MKTNPDENNSLKNKMKKYAIFGGGGHAREVAAHLGREVTFFVDDKYSTPSFHPISEFKPSEYLMMVAVADSKERFKIVNRLPAETEYFSFIHPSAILLDPKIQIGEGSFVGANCVLTTNIQIGNHAILNRGNHIGHDCKIGDFFSAMPSAVLGGNVYVGNRVYFGSCSNVREKTTILDDIIIGMNAAVVKNIFEPGTYVGVPAKKIK